GRCGARDDPPRRAVMAIGSVDRSAGIVRTMANPTGEQLELTRGNVRAVVTEIGAGLRAFEINKVPYLETFEEDAEPPKAAGQVLLPWPNRTKGARWIFDGEPQELERSEEHTSELQSRENLVCR